MIYELKRVNRDGKFVIKLKCPRCEVYGEIDDDQYHGRISIQCTDECGFHETINFLSVNQWIQGKWIQNEHE